MTLPPTSPFITSVCHTPETSNGLYQKLTVYWFTLRSAWSSISTRATVLWAVSTNPGSYSWGGSFTGLMVMFTAAGLAEYSLPSKPAQPKLVEPLKSCIGVKVRLDISARTISSPTDSSLPLSLIVPLEDNDVTLIFVMASCSTSLYCSVKSTEMKVMSMSSSPDLVTSVTTGWSLMGFTWMLTDAADAAYSVPSWPL